MSFNDEENIDKPPLNKGLKLSNQASSIEKPKKPDPSSFKEAVKKVEEADAGYKKKATELSIKFKKMLSDKTLPQNRSIFLNESEQETLSDMIQLASEINNDPNEQESIGSLMWITLLLKTCLSQRDRINLLEYSVLQLEKKCDKNLPIKAELDKK